MSHKKFLIVGALWASLAACGPAGGNDTRYAASRDMGPLLDVIAEESDEIWSARFEGNDLRLQNRGGRGAIRYYYVAPDAGEEGAREISVNVGLLDTQAGSQAGLLYGFEHDPRSYFMFTVDDSGSVGLYFLENGNLEERMRSTIRGLDLGDTRLTIRESGSSIALLVNGKEFSQIGGERMGRGAAGIVAANVGDYRFGGFTLHAPDTRQAVTMPVAQAVNAGQHGGAAAPLPRSETSSWTFHDIADRSDGMIERRVPLPPGWHVDAEHNFVGPEGMRTVSPLFYSFMYSSDPFAMETIRMMGNQAVAPLMSLDDYLQSAVVPALEQRGYKLITRYAMPEMVTYMRRGFALSPAIANRDWRSMGTEWERRDGKRSLIVLTQSVRHAGDLLQWSISSLELEAPPARLEHAKSVLLQALAGTQFNPQWQQREENKLQAGRARSEQFWGEATRQSAAAHQSRMQAIQSRAASSAAVANTYSEILDINHAGYLNRSSMVDAGQTRSVNVTSGHAVIGHGESGERYRVESGSSHYWVNSRGEYFGTDNSLYDPRTDQRISDQQWTPFEVID